MAFVAKRKITGIAMLAVTAVYVMFIFSQSLMNSTASDSESMGLTAVVNSWFSSLGINIVLENGFMRKLAHFAEFFVLGVLTVVTSRCYTKTPSKYLFVQLFSTLAAAVTDEYIQLYSDGRSGQVTDVALDFAGSLCGILITTFIYFVFRKSKGK